MREALKQIENSLKILQHPIESTVYDFFISDSNPFIFVDDLNNYNKLHYIQINYRSLEKENVSKKTKLVLN